MDLWETIRVIARRWYVAVPALIVLLGATYGVVSSIDPTYQASTIVTLLPPPERAPTPVGEPEQPVGNPYLTGTEGFRILTILLEEAFQGNAVGVTLRQEYGFTEEYSYELLREDGSPVMTLQVEAPTPVQALEGAADARDLLDEVLLQQQAAADVATDRLIRTQTVSEALVAVELSGSRTRVAIGLGAASVLLSLGLAYAVDGFLARRTGGVASSGGPRRRDRSATVAEQATTNGAQRPNAPVRAPSESSVDASRRIARRRRS